MNANFTILSSNINVDSEPRIKPYVKKSYVTTVGGEKIGVIGYTTKDTPMISQPGEYKNKFVRFVEGGGGEVGHFVLRLHTSSISESCFIGQNDTGHIHLTNKVTETSN